MLTRLAVKNFKSISDEGVTIYPKPLTVLVGPNGSGKSSTIEAFAMLAQSVGLLGLQPKGNLLSIGDRLDPIVHMGDTRRKLSIEIGMIPDDSIILDRGAPEKENKYKFSVVPSIHQFEQEFVLIYNVLQTTVVSVNAYTQVVEEGQLHALVRYPLNGGALFHTTGEDISRVLSSKVFEPLRSYTRADPDPSLVQREWQQVKEASDQMSQKIKNKVAFLSALRGEVAETIQVGVDPKWVGNKSEHLVHLISVIFGRRKHFEARDKIISWAKEFGLSGLSAGYRGGQEIGADYEEPRFRTPLGLNLASQGSRQVLSVIVQLFAGEPGDIVMIEEPEISLHPEAQVKLVELFADAIAWGKQIIFTTHSHYLLLAITRAVQRGLLTRDQLAIYEIKNEDERGSVATELPVSDSGVIEGWVSSFASVDLELLKSQSS